MTGWYLDPSFCNTHCVSVPFLLDLGCYDNFNLKKKNTVECLCMFHRGQMFLWSMMGCGRMIHTVLVDAWFAVEKHCQFEDEASVQHIWRCWCFSRSLICRGTLSRVFGPTPHRVEYNMLSNGRCNVWFVRSRWSFDQFPIHQAACVKMTSRLVVLFPFTSRTALPRWSSNTRGQPRYVNIDLISGSNISISSRIREVLHRIEEKPKL